MAKKSPKPNPEKNAEKPTRGVTAPTINLEITTSVLRKTCDWLFVLQRNGQLKSVEHQSDDQPAVNFRQWVDRSFLETVTVECKSKLEALLNHNEADPSRWRQINHPLPDGPDLPVRYSAYTLDSSHIMLVGQNVRDLAEMQQRLINAQQAIESDFAKLAQAKTRYQLLFDLSAEALLNVDVKELKIIDANPAAQRLLGRYIAPLKNNRFPTGFDKDSTAALEGLLRQAQLTGRADDVAICTADNRASFLASAALLRDRIDSVLMIRLSPIGDAGIEHFESQTVSLFESVVANSPDAIVLSDLAGNIVATNETFLNMTQQPSMTNLIGQPLDNWLGRSSLDHRMLANNLKEHGAVPKFSTVIAGIHGTDTEVEISAASIPDAKLPYMLMVIRNVQGRLAPVSDDRRMPNASGPPLQELVGRVPLKELVKESTDLIEKLCIESALEMTSDNRASAAEMLGLSRQSLYVKLRRFGLDNNISQDT